MPKIDAIFKQKMLNVSKKLSEPIKELEFIENSRKVFHVIKYDDINGMEKMNPTDLKSGHIKVVVINKKKPKLLCLLVQAPAVLWYPGQQYLMFKHSCMIILI
jgi:hypothetical protein